MSLSYYRLHLLLVLNLLLMVGGVYKSSDTIDNLANTDLLICILWNVFLIIIINDVRHFLGSHQRVKI